MKSTAKLEQDNPVNTVISLIKKRKIIAINQDTDVDLANIIIKETWLQETLSSNNRYSDSSETNITPANTSAKFDLQTGIITSDIHLTTNK